MPTPQKSLGRGGNGRAKKKPLKILEPFDKYWHYINAVQDPNVEMADVAGYYRSARQRRIASGKAQPGEPTEARILREDFCGTFVNCCAWVAAQPGRIAHGVDLDPEPLDYGRQTFLPGLSPEARSRVHVHQKNVLDPSLPKADLICALNFSYFLLRTRAEMLAYFRAARAALRPGGIFLLDHLGGPEMQEPNEEVTDWEELGFAYYWDQVSFDPTSHEAEFHIHFKRQGEKKREKVFSYQWRLWTLPELRDVLADAGFTDVEVLWEGEDEDGEPDGIFLPVDKAEDCTCFNAYLLAHR